MTTTVLFRTVGLLVIFVLVLAQVHTAPIPPGACRIVGTLQTRADPSADPDAGCTPGATVCNPLLDTFVWVCCGVVGHPGCTYWYQVHCP